MEPDRVDPLLGQLMFDDALSWYAGRYHTAAHGAVNFTISLDAVSGVEAALHEARTASGDYLGADADDLVYVTNATVGLNIVARSLELHPGDEVLTTST